MKDNRKMLSFVVTIQCQSAYPQGVVGVLDRKQTIIRNSFAISFIFPDKHWQGIVPKRAW